MKSRAAPSAMQLKVMPLPSQSRLFSVSIVSSASFPDFTTES
ncbi:MULTISPECIES: hypothetical protein [Atopobiaceae]|nr:MULTISPECIES: hypothetical protein [Atopobiaceae]